MSSKGWRLSFPIMVIIAVLLLVNRWFGTSPLPLEDAKNTSEVFESAASDVRVYFPALLDMTYFFAGQGMEYADFTRQVTHLAPHALQIEDLSGTNLAQVVEVGPEELRIVWAEEEFYAEESLLDQAARQERKSGMSRNLILLQAPVVPGHAWKDERFHREIIAVDETVTVPVGTFYEVVTVKSRSAETDSFVTYEYYAKNIGLIKRVSISEAGDASIAIVSDLTSLAGPPPSR